MLKTALKVFGVLLLALCAIGGWWYFLDGRPPAVRTDLVRMPDSFGPPPQGYPTENALMFRFVTGTLDLIDREAPVPVPDGVVETLDIEYGREGDISLKLDLYAPANASEPLPAILFIHGGGWTQGDKSDYKLYVSQFPLKGYVAATMGYRFADDFGFPGCVSDTKCAVRWLRANAERLHIDPDKIAVAGGSAGGYLAMMAGYSSDVSRVRGHGRKPGGEQPARRCDQPLWPHRPDHRSRPGPPHDYQFHQSILRREPGDLPAGLAPVPCRPE